MHLQIVPDKRAGLNGSTQHWLAVYLQESRELNLFASFESNGTLPRLGPIEHGSKDRLFVRSIIELINYMMLHQLVEVVPLIGNYLCAYFQIR